MDFGRTIAQLALRYGDRSAILDQSGAWSFRQFHDRIKRFGNAMAGIGLAPGDRIALLIPDCRDYLVADYGTMAGGFVRVPIDPRLTRREIITCLQHAQASALIVHGQFADKVADLCREVATLR